MDRKAEFIKSNKGILGKNIGYEELDRRYIKWLEQKLANAEAENASHNKVYTQCPVCNGSGQDEYHGTLCMNCEDGQIV